MISTTSQKKPLIEVILVEDDPGHARLIQKKLTHDTHNLVVKAHFDSGEAALDYFFNLETEDTADLNKDDLGRKVVLLDLNMPGTNGYQVLQLLKAIEKTKHIPAIVLTTTREASDVKRCYQLGCNAYISKPVNYDQFCTSMRHLGELITKIEVPA